jgi:phage tail protein X
MTAALSLRGESFMHSPRLGYLSTDPANLGTGLRVRLLIRLPKLCARDNLEEIVHMLRLNMHRGTDGMVDISNCDHLGRTEVELANNVIHAAQKLIALEQALEESHMLGLESILKEIETAHATDTVYNSSHFSEEELPLALPDLSAHRNVLATVMRADPTLYADHRAVEVSGPLCLCWRPF